MSTRSLTHIHDGDLSAPVILTMQTDCDGFPRCYGARLAECISGNQKANGIECLAATIVAHFKKGIGGFYIQQPGTSLDVFEEYTYHVYTNEHVFCLRVFCADSKAHIFDGNATAYPKWLEAHTASEEAGE